jgi:hypothetical protein
MVTDFDNSIERILCWLSYVVDHVVPAKEKHLIDGRFPRIPSDLVRDSFAQLLWTVGMTSCTLLILAIRLFPRRYVRML